MRILTVGLVLLTTSCAPTSFPRAINVPTTHPVRTLHQCVTEQLIDAGFTVVETSRDDGLVIAEVRSETERGMRIWHRLEALAFERMDGSTTLHVRTASAHNYGQWRAPEGGVEGVSDAIEGGCTV